MSAILHSGTLFTESLENNSLHVKTFRLVLKNESVPFYFWMSLFSRKERVRRMSGRRKEEDDGKGREEEEREGEGV